jgi:hypothetical protein
MIVVRYDLSHSIVHILGFELLMLELIGKKAKIISYHRDYCRHNSNVQSKNGRKRHKVDIGAAPKSNKGNNKITELRTILQRESQNS